MVAIVNDTVGTLVAHAYEDPETSVGVIIGTYVAMIDSALSLPTMMMMMMMIM